MTDEGIYDVDRNAEEATTTTNALENNEDVPPPPVESQSNINKIVSKVREFKEKYSGLLLPLAVVWLLFNIIVAIIALVKGCQEWNKNRELSVAAFSCLFVATSMSIYFGSYCYKRRARIWNLYGYQIDDNNHRNTIAADNNRAREAGA
ncbi:unnamed protein product [[Candida] boidinii]|uniref:Unnamed protein product n=1 Tax=Candida boidinii TaxID=5477 RepID=A0A9W6SZX6_CANBO|nr:hypothetical protein B5S30_g5490 [[Candida] boidinii]OWB86874.1 hypothetical protein B5S33_g5596 [[Candida] boidinii]GME71910.1 unnamed protein product [[Candida] boidinii]GME87238.1 unnamed protein product [[Candida] boidinii]GMF99560.1 unnamed protein product [[Candida] boidinii]